MRIAPVGTRLHNAAATEDGGEDVFGLPVIPGRSQSERTRNPDTCLDVASGFRVRGLEPRPGMTKKDNEACTGRPRLFWT